MIQAVLFGQGPRAAAPTPGPRARAAIFAGGAVLAWSTWPMLATLAAAPPFLTFGLAAAIGWAVCFAQAILTGRAGGFIAAPLGTILFVGVMLLANNVTYLMAMPRIGAAEANVVAYLWPVMLVALGSLLDGEAFGWRKAVGLALGFGGAVLVIGPSFGAGADPVGIALALASGLIFAVYAFIRSRAGEAGGDVIGPSLGVIAVLSLGLHMAFGAPTSLAPVQLAAIAGIGLLPLGAANMLWDRAARTGALSLISGIAYLTPFGAMLLLALTGLGTVTAAAWIGGTLVVAGAFLAGRAPKKGHDT
ncbi:MAG: DMT family transporter [Shimia sp.]